MFIQSKNKEESRIYKGNYKYINLSTRKDTNSSQKTGNRELDKGLAQLKYNAMPNIVRAIAEGVSF